MHATWLACLGGREMAAEDWEDASEGYKGKGRRLRHKTSGKYKYLPAGRSTGVEYKQQRRQAIQQREATRAQRAGTLAGTLARLISGEVDPEEVAEALDGLGVKQLRELRRRLKIKPGPSWTRSVAGEKRAILDHLQKLHASAAGRGSEGLVASIIDEPEDETNRLVFSDWLEDQGRPNAARRVRAAAALAGQARSLSAPDHDPDQHDYGQTSTYTAANRVAEKLGPKARLLWASLAARNAPLPGGGTLGRAVTHPHVRRALALAELHWAGVVGEEEYNQALEAAQAAVKAQYEEETGEEMRGWMWGMRNMSDEGLANLAAVQLLSGENSRALQILEARQRHAAGEGEAIAGGEMLEVDSDASSRWAVALARALPGWLRQTRQGQPGQGGA